MKFCWCFPQGLRLQHSQEAWAPICFCGWGLEWCAPAAVWIKTQRERPRHPEKSRNVGKGPQGQRILVGAGLDRSCCSALTHPWKLPALPPCKFLPGRTPGQLESGPVSQSVMNWYWLVLAALGAGVKFHVNVFYINFSSLNSSLFIWGMDVMLNLIKNCSST